MTKTHGNKPIEQPRAAKAAPGPEKSLSGLTLDNVEERVEGLRKVSEPTRKARQEINRISRARQQLAKKPPVK